MTTTTATPTVPTMTSHHFSFSLSPPSSTGTFDSVDRTMDSIYAMPDTPGFCVQTPPHAFATTATPVPMPETVTTAVAVEPQDAAAKTGYAKRRNKNDTTSPHVFPSQQQQQQQPQSVSPQASFHQSIRSPPQFNVNLKKTRKPAVGGGTTRLRRQHQQPRPSSLPEPLQ
jgi:hypothetical protein